MIVNNFKTRREQFAFFLGYISVKSSKQLEVALNKLEDWGCDYINPEVVFENCPFNKDIKQIMRSYHIFEKGKKTDLEYNLIELIGEFIFLSSNFVPPCCGDGRAFYAIDNKKRIILECDSCGDLYDIYGNKTDGNYLRKAMVNDFALQFGIQSKMNWPYIEKVANL